MDRVLVLGDEALALGAVDAGLSIAYGYPGTPSTEIIEYLQRYAEEHDPDLVARWCANEKTSYEGAVGVSYAGKRSLVTMKHVGLNVAADAFINSALLDIHGGLVAAVCDDPGMHSSQNEQDSRFYADFAGIMCFEPRNHQEVYEMTREAYDISERFKIPVLVKLVTRLSHSRAVITRRKPLQKIDRGKAQDPHRWMALPSLSRKNWQDLIDQKKIFTEYSEHSPFNTVSINENYREFGVITTGLAGSYYRENLPDLEAVPSHLHIGVYPVPEEKIKFLAAHVKKIIIFEEGYPFVERMITSILSTALPIHGKLDGTVPPSGELTPDILRPALGLPLRGGIQQQADLSLPGRPPQLCKGCPHTDTFTALNHAVEGLTEHIVTSDIGCYALGALPPLSSIETLLCMGASVGMARGASEAGRKNVVATIGDSTFLHSGITGLIDAASTNTDMTLIIMDNSTTAMTGMQKTIVSSPRIRDIVLACGVVPEHLKEIQVLPKHDTENTEIIKRELAYHGLSVIIALRECIHIVGKKK